MKKDTKLYNVLFPFWMLMLIPTVWFIVLPGNFIIDSIVLIIAMKFLNTENKKTFYKKNIFKIYCFGLLADVIGSALLFIFAYVFELGIMGDELYLTVPALILSAVCIFVFNFFVTFRKLETPIRRKFALIFAIATAPYTFLIPSSWLY